jgi:hypothetical protein
MPSRDKLAEFAAWCRIAGTSHRDLKTVEPSVAPGAFFVLKRELAKAHDALAIMIFNEAGHHLGYVPRAKNEALAHLMDAGKLLFGKLEAKQWVGGWLKVEARIYLRDF